MSQELSPDGVEQWELQVPGARFQRETEASLPSLTAEPCCFEA